MFDAINHCATAALYTVHGYEEGTRLVFMRCGRIRSRKHTKRVMNHVNFLTGGVVPNSTNVDFERGAINDGETVPKY